jgi:ribosomal protein L32
MSGKYPTKELIKILPQQWFEDFVGNVDENNEDGAFVKLGKKSDLLPSGRVRPIIEMLIEDKETNSEVLDYIDHEMEQNTFLPTNREVVEYEGKKYYVISRTQSPLTSTKKVTILYAQDRFLVHLQGESNILTAPLAHKIVRHLNFSVELMFPEEPKRSHSPADAIESMMTAAYSPMMKEAESLQVELDELEKLLVENKITTDEYQKRQIELQGKAMAMSQNLMGVGFAQQMQLAQSQLSQLCPKCGALAVNVKFCPECGTKIPEAAKCSSCGTVVQPNQKFCPECGTPQTN